MAVADKSKLIERMFTIGAHFAYSRSRRHPSTKPFIFGAKSKVEIFDLEKTSDILLATKEFVKKLASEGKTILFVGGKNEAYESVLAGARAIEAPVSSPRWIGGTITNWSEIKKRMNRLAALRTERESGELAKKYTKKEQLLIDREIARLEDKFAGLMGLEKLPDALLVVDPRREHIAVAEARAAKIPVIAILNSDCDASLVDYPVIGNDATPLSIRFFIEELVAAYREGKKERPLAA